jgi:hypothetical protein
MDEIWQGAACVREDDLATRVILQNSACQQIHSLIHRAATMLPFMPRTLGLWTEELVEAARTFYFDTAISSNPVTLKQGAACVREDDLATRVILQNSACQQIHSGPTSLIIWADLSRRDAVVFIHPTHPVDTQLVNQWLPQPMFDYPCVA